MYGLHDVFSVTSWFEILSLNIDDIDLQLVNYERRSKTVSFKTVICLK